MKNFFLILIAAILLTAVNCWQVSAQQLPAPPLGSGPTSILTPPPTSVYSPFINFQAKYDAWLDMVHRTHEEEQPDWMTPIATVIPTLQQEIRTDYDFTFAPHGVQTFTYVSKGTEIIPTENTEFIFGNPTYITKNLPADKDTSGWADWPLLFKYRLLSSPSEAGNYVVTFELAMSFATGSNTYVSANHDIFSPLIAFGKGIKTQYGEFDYQATIGPSVPDGQTGMLGTPVTWNSAFQYGNRFHIGGWSVPLWPEFETSWVAYPNGENRGQQQLYLLPGIIAGRFKMTEHTYFVLGAGLQFAATDARTFNHQWLVTMRIPYF
jgi:hypothetical protein